MRLVLLAASLLLAFPAFAQTQFADSTGAYVGFSGGYYSGNAFGGRFGASVTLGYRFSPTVDAEVRMATTPYSWSAGTGAGRTWRVGTASRARLSAGLLYHNADDLAINREVPRQRFLLTDAALTMSQTVPLGGTLRLDPAVGVYGAAARNLSVVAGPDGVFHRESYASTGAVVELPLSFRLWGRTATIAPSLHYRLVGDRLAVPTGGTTVRLNF